MNLETRNNTTEQHNSSSQKPKIHTFDVYVPTQQLNTNPPKKWKKNSFPTSLGITELTMEKLPMVAASASGSTSVIIHSLVGELVGELLWWMLLFNFEPSSENWWLIVSSPFSCLLGGLQPFLSTLLMITCYYKGARILPGFIRSWNTRDIASP